MRMATIWAIKHRNQFARRLKEQERSHIMANKNLLAPGQAHDQSSDINKMGRKRDFMLQ